MIEDAERIGKLEARVDNVEHILIGNGQPGLNRITLDFISEWRGREKERAQEEKARSRRTTVWLAVLSIAVALFGILPNAATTVKRMLSFFSSDQTISKRVAPPQDAGLPIQFSRK